MSPHSNISDYSRYFCLRQKVYLVNMSAERNTEIYESLSGVVTFSGVDSLELMITHGGCGSTNDNEAGAAVYKLTSEALGSGIQVLADLVGVVTGNIFRFRMHGALEMFQRRSVPRVDLSARIFHVCGNFPLASFKKEWQRIMERLSNNAVPPGLVLQETEINLSAGGIGLTVDLKSRPTPLSMFFVALDEGLPFCALAETAWEQVADEKLRCGFRFIHILKTDQERINSCVSELMRKSGGAHMDYKRNWVLVDKMVVDERKAG
ncbi:MAG: PilZ domain-containing protein [Geobacteraceae bacterium]|nr:PilZ domain-containing protein [Geobacteraceae bacterium]NTW78525.1 PilZ domain-containing protein [Geobacteraceae bacterium]